MLRSLIIENPKTSLSFKKVFLERTKDLIKKILCEYDEPGRSIVVILTVSGKKKIGYCHILPVEKKDKKGFNTFFVGIPTGLEDDWDERKIENIERITFNHSRQPCIIKKARS